MLTATYLNARGVHYLRTRNINAPLPGTFDRNDPSSGVRPFGDVGNIFEYESSGIFKQHQLIISVLNRLNRNYTLFATYVLGKANGDTEGVNTYPANTYDLTDEFSRSIFDMRHRAYVGGSFNMPWGVNLSPLILLTSGTPFNITTGIDANGDTLATERPAFATDLSKASVRITRYGAFDLDPEPGQRIIPRNLGDGPGFFLTNLRISKTFGFGSGRATGSRVSAAEMPYRLTIGIFATNIFNHANHGTPVGNLSSPFFGQSTSLRTLGDIAGNAAATNRRIDLQVRFNF